MEDEKRKIKLTPGIAKQKIESWCAYQERSHFEVREKLYSYGLYSSEVEQIIASLITDNFLNEERFALAYVSGKFRIKKWGRVKIKQGLKQKRVSEYCIKKGINSIDPDEYEKTLYDLIEKKAASVKEKNEFKRKSKIALYAISRGFESDLVWEALKEED